jgi:hypothetical protein
VVLLLISIARLSGHNLDRLLRDEKPLPEMTPVGVPHPPVIAPPVIKT